MITNFKEGTIDAAIGLTEGWVNGLSQHSSLYKIVGTYVMSPLCMSRSLESRGMTEMKVGQLAQELNRHIKMQKN